MTPEQWERVSELFGQAADLPVAEREGFLEQCDWPGAVVDEVRALLAEHENSGHALLDDATGAIAGELAPSPAPDTVPERVGAYRIIREIGRGGMGIVYLACRDDGQFEQDVALKLVRLGLDSDDVRRRFLFERQLLARLQHPGIARLFDGGIADDSRPYFVMEFVDGVALFDYCDHHALTIDQRLRLFIRVCDAVQYAHQALIVHRDLKPSNILVGKDGEPRLLDFGIAKLLDVEALGDDAPRTRTEMSLLTPEYGAPEQLRGEPVTTATDVYALGVILYELLSGRRPYDFATRSVVAIYDALVKTDPRRPSASVMRQRATVAELAQRRGTTAQRLVRRLRGDLDAIAMTALAKEPQRRYPSAGALGEDVRRFLDQRPIFARGDSAGYRVGKFLRRHAVAVLAAVLVSVSLTGGLAATAWQGRIAAREAAKAEAVSGFLLDMLASADPDAAQGRDLTVRELVDTASERLDDEEGAVDDPQVEATIRATLGETLRALGQYDAAQGQLRRALALSERARSAVDPATLQLRSNLGAALFDAGRIDDAEPLLREVLEAGVPALGAEHPIVQEARVRYAGIHYRRGELARAEALLRDSVAMSLRLHGPDHEQTLTAQSNLAASIARQGRLDDAAPLLERTLEGLRRLHGEADRLSLVTMDNLANIHLELGNYARAVELNERAVGVRAGILDARHPALLESRGRLAGAYHAADRLGDARRLFDEVLPVMREVLGEDHPNTLLARGNAALLAADLGEGERALDELRRVVAELVRTLGETHPLTAAMRQEYEARAAIVGTPRPERK